MRRMDGCQEGWRLFSFHVFHVCQGKSLICQGKSQGNVREFRKARSVATMNFTLKQICDPLILPQIKYGMGL